MAPPQSSQCHDGEALSADEGIVEGSFLTCMTPISATPPSLEEILQPALQTGLCAICRVALESLVGRIASSAPTMKSSEDEPSKSFTLADLSVTYSSPLPHYWFMSESCMICRQFSKKLPELRQEPEEIGKSDFLITVSFWSWGRSRERPDLTGVLLRATYLDRGSFLVELLKAQQIPHSLTPALTDFAVPNRTTASSSARNLAIGWLHRCKQLNKAVDKKSGRSFKPTRLLDTRKARHTGFLTLVTTSQMTMPTVEDQYITLSYCWGPHGASDNPLSFFSNFDNHLLLVSNFRHRREVGLRVSRLPKTFRDAIQVCNWFEVRWLWIDSLCIVQDSQHDWLRESDLFGKTYKNALLNISADVGPSPHFGCFSDRAELDVFRPQGQVGESGETYILTIESENRLIHLDEYNTSASRAWIHRERQLSPRVLHFTRGEMVWECCENLHQGSFASESLPDGVDFQIPLSLRHLSLINDRSLSPGEVHAHWRDLCRDMSGKDLTKRSDMALIMSDLAKDFSRLQHPGRYLAVTGSQHFRMISFGTLLDCRNSILNCRGPLGHGFRVEGK
ncbi:heterokaryon incompatibility protein-domain-containing protein [Nemania sp. FL0031]|nr:heterokaryon incompatibility protein-domain-containing protein [Nemania sp. FL0031]